MHFISSIEYVVINNDQFTFPHMLIRKKRKFTFLYMPIRKKKGKVVAVTYVS